MHQQIMNFPFNDHLALMTQPEPMFPETGYPGATSQFPGPGQLNGGGGGGPGGSPMEAMREMMFRVAAMQPVRVDPDSVRPRKRRNVRISSDPQSVAARHRRERISERIRILQRLVPGGTKMDTASMLEEAVRYLKFLKREVRSLEEMGQVAVSGRQGWPWRGPGVGAAGPAGHCVASSSRSTWGMGGPYSFMHSNVVE